MACINLLRAGSDFDSGGVCSRSDCGVAVELTRKHLRLARDEADDIYLPEQLRRRSRAPSLVL